MTKHTPSEKEKELFFEADVREHQRLVMKYMMAVVYKLLYKARTHDDSKLTSAERPYYIDPVYELNNSDIGYGSEEYKKLVSKMGEGWKHHAYTNDHHIEFFVPYSVQTLNDPIRSLDLIALIEMLCDWIAASKRGSADSGTALNQMIKKYPVDEQLQAIIRNTLSRIEIIEKQESEIQR